MSLLTLIQRSCALLSIPVPTFAVGSTDQQVRQLIAIANEEGDNLAGSYDWQILREQATFTTVATANQPAAVPVDWDRFIANSFFNRTTQRYVWGPLTPQQWQSIQAQPQLNRVYLGFIQRHGEFLITPTPPAGQTIAYEYITRNWCKSAANVPQSEYLADTDEAYLDERLMALGVRWRFLKSKGLEYSEDFRTYESEKTQKQARDGGNSAISTTGTDYFLYGDNIPAGSFPGPI